MDKELKTLTDVTIAYRKKRWGWTLLAVLVLIFLLSLLLGRYPVPFITPPSLFWNDPRALQLLLHIRLPRIIAAFLTGMVLAAAGTVLQMVFRNPLVDTGFLGVSQGAGFGASLAIVALGGSPAMIQLCAGLFAMLGLGISYFFVRRIRLGDWILRLVLAGISVSALFSAGGSVLKYMADPLKQLPDITFWLMGGLWSITWPDVIQILPVTCICLVVMYLMRWRLNLLAMRDETIFSLGVSAGRERLVLLLAAVSGTAVIVSKAGLVGWVGLIVPHITRRLLGADAQTTLPGSMLLGGIFVLLGDNAARTVLSGEIPLGIITSFFGATLFLFLLLRGGVSVKRK